MKNKKDSNLKIDGLFKAKERFHKERAKLPFEEKIQILFRLQEIAHNIKPIRLKRFHAK